MSSLPKSQWISKFKQPLLQAILTGVVFVILALIYYNVSRERSITVEASTETVTIRFASKSIWRFENTLVCLRISQKRLRSSQRPTAELRREILKGQKCGELESPQTGTASLSFRAGQEVNVSSIADGVHQITIKSSDDSEKVEALVDNLPLSITPLSRILIKPADGLKNSVLPFEGQISIGSEIRSGTQSILISGKFEMLEVLPGWEKPTRVFTGNLVQGDLIRFTDANKSKQSSIGFLSSVSTVKNSFNVIATHKAKDAKLELFRTGFAPALIQPKWTDRAVADPVTIAIASLLGLLAVIVTFLNELRSLIAMKKED